MVLIVKFLHVLLTTDIHKKLLMKVYFSGIIGSSCLSKQSIKTVGINSTLGTWFHKQNDFSMKLIHVLSPSIYLLKENIVVRDPGKNGGMSLYLFLLMQSKRNICLESKTKTRGDITSGAT